MRKAILLYYNLLCALITAVVGALLVPVTLQVVSRYTDLIPTLIWTEEAARFLLVWMIMLGATIAVRMRGHFDIDLLPEPRTAKGRVIARLVVDATVAAFGVAFFWVGAGYTFDAANEVSEITEMSMAYMYAAFPISAAGWLLFLGEQIFDDLCELGRSDA
jgi:TRAP-type C4-dicarboxylate transport system permease small subunit